MTKTYGLNSIIKYVYGEASQREIVSTELAILGDRKVAKYCQSFFKLRQQIDKLAMEPREECIQNILNYSKNKATVL